MVLKLTGIEYIICLIVMKREIACHSKADKQNLHL
jgi:hypothetical protein